MEIPYDTMYRLAWTGNGTVAEVAAWAHYDGTRLDSAQYPGVSGTVHPCTYHYDNAGLLREVNIRRVANGLGTLPDSEAERYQYDLQGRIVREVYYYIEAGSIQDSIVIKYAYNTNGQLMSKVDSTASVFWRKQFTYDAQGRISRELHDKFDVTWSLWEEEREMVYGYVGNSHRVFSKTQRIPDTSGLWLESSLALFTYNACGAPKSWILSYKNGQTGLWEATFSERIDYDSAGNLARIRRYKKGGIQEWEKRYYYNTADRTATPDGGCHLQTISESHSRITLQLHPNPAKDKLFLPLLLEYDGVAELFDYGGRLITRHPLQKNLAIHTLSIDDLIPGHYFIRVTDHRGSALGHSAFVRRP